MPIPNTQTVVAPVAPNSVNDVYPTHVDEYGKGGFHAITTGASNGSTATDTQIGAVVKAERRKVGMLLFDTSSGFYYRCTSTAGATGNYVREDFGANEGSVTSVGLSMPDGFNVSNTPITSSGTLNVSTTLTGVIKGTGAGFDAAVAGQDYAAASHTHPISNLSSIAANRLVGRYSSTTGSGQAIQVGSGLDLDTSTGVLTSTGLGGTVTTISGNSPISATTIDGGETFVVSHGNSGVTAGSYGSASSVGTFTVDAKGHLTAAGSTPITGFLPTSGGTVSGDVTLSGESSDLTVGGNATISGNLTVNGTQTVINTTTLSVDDKNIELAATVSPSDTAADGGGITLRGDSDHTIQWSNASDQWTSSENWNLASGRVYRINGAQVLSGTALGTSVVSSNLATVGTIASGTWQGTTIAGAYGGTGVNLTTLADGGLLKRSGSAVATAVAGSDYLNDQSEIDGGTY